MTLPHDPNLGIGGQPQGRSPRQLAGIVGEYVRGALALMLWILVAVAGAATFYVGLRTVWWATEAVLKALGV
jgi:hypothetical protein